MCIKRISLVLHEMTTFLKFIVGLSMELRRVMEAASKLVLVTQ